MFIGIECLIMKLSVKVGDLIKCSLHGVGIITATTGGSFTAFFCKWCKKGWFSAAWLGDSMEIIGESR